MDDHDDSISRYSSQYSSVESDERPNSLLQCKQPDGSVDTGLYMKYLQKQSELSDIERNLVELPWQDQESDSLVVSSPKVKRRRSAKSLRPYYFDDNGEPVYLQPRKTVWYYMYVKGPAIDNPLFHSKFRRRFRLPFDEYKILLV